MLERGILKPVLPEIEPAGVALVEASSPPSARPEFEPDALAGLSALLPPDPLLAEKIAARLKLSNKARKRLACAARASTRPNPQALAYRVGIECALDRLLLAGEPRQGGDARGLARAAAADRRRSADCARSCRRAGRRPHPATRSRTAGSRPAFPTGDAFERIVADALAPRRLVRSSIALELGYVERRSATARAA